MKKETISDIIGKIDDAYLAEAASMDFDKTDEKSNEISDRKKRMYGFRRGAVAACLAVLILAGSTAAVMRVEAAEYRTASDFFEENGLSAEGLTRSEVKAVYRDISTNRFDYEKTADVILQAVSGFEIPSGTPTSGDLVALWEENLRRNEIPQQGIGYKTRYQYEIDKQRGVSVFTKSVVECYRDGTKIWSAEIKDFHVEGTSAFDSGTIVWGHDYAWDRSSDQTVTTWLARIDDAGTVLWKKSVDHGFEWENIASVLDNGDGSFAVISGGGPSFLCLGQYGADGKEKSFHKNDVGFLGIGVSIRLEDGYLIQLGNISNNVRHTAVIAKLDRDGKLSGRFTYQEEGKAYYVTDMLEYEGQIYLSSYAISTEEYEETMKKHFDELMKAGYVPLASDETLTSALRSSHTAVLLVCDRENGDPKTFYSVDGSLGGTLTKNKSGLLEWRVESISSTFFSPATNSFSIGGICQVFSYFFDDSGTLVGSEDTGETTAFRR